MTAAVYISRLPAFVLVTSRVSSAWQFGCLRLWMAAARVCGLIYEVVLEMGDCILPI